MTNTLLRIYPLAAPLVLGPLSAWLWWQTFQNWPQTLLAWLIPVLWAYIIPGIGTNVCKVWEFDLRLRLGRFRPHHGFVFGSATATIAWLMHGQPAQSPGDVLRYSVVLCSVLGFWNWMYEIRILRAGILRVYNQPWAQGHGPEAIASDYSPWFFGGFGAAYGLAIGGAEWWLHHHAMPGWPVQFAVFTVALALCMALPVLGFMHHSWRRHGHFGTRPVARINPKGE